MPSPPHPVTLTSPNCLYNRCTPWHLVYRLNLRPDGTVPPLLSNIIRPVRHSIGIWSRRRDGQRQPSSVRVGCMSSCWFSANRLRQHRHHTMLHSRAGSAADETAFLPPLPIRSSLLHRLWSVSFGQRRAGWNGNRWRRDARCPDC